MAGKSKKGILTIFLLVFLCTFGLGAFAGGYVNNIFLESVESKGAKGKPINVLFMGIDARDTKSNSRSDTMIVASIDPGTKKIAMVSIPRDTRIKDSRDRSEKINSVNYLYGPQAACREAGKLLNTRIDHYVVTNFAGFGKIVDTLGGVHLEVEDDMIHEDPINPELAINIPKGQQYLDGEQALGYVRYRGGPTADIGRTERQQKFILALLQEMLDSKTILKLPRLVPLLNENIHTNIPVKDMAYLANLAKKFNPANITAQTLPGYPFTDPSNGASYWLADQEKSKVLLASLLQGKTLAVIGDPPEEVKRARRISRPAVNPVEPPVMEEPLDQQNGNEQIAEEMKTDGNAEKENKADPSSSTDSPDDQPEERSPSIPDPTNGAENPESESINQIEQN